MSDKPVWDKPRPKGLGKSHKLSSSQKAKAKAAAKAAGRPYPNLVDNMRAARAFGGMAYEQQNLMQGMGTPMAGMPMGNPSTSPTNPQQSGQINYNPNNIQPVMPSPGLPPPQPVQAPVGAPPVMSDNVPRTMAKGGAVEDALRLAKQGKFRLHQSIARHGYSTDGAVEEDNTSVDNTSVNQPNYEKASQFEQQQLMSGEPQIPQTNREMERSTEKWGNRALTLAKDAAYLIPETRPIIGAYNLAHGLATGNPSEMAQSIFAAPGKVAKAIGAAALSQQPESEGANPRMRFVRNAYGYGQGGEVKPNLYPDGLTHRGAAKTPSSTSGSTTTPQTSRPISPDEYKKGNLKGGEFVMANGGSIHPDIQDALRLASRQHFRHGGMGYTLPPGVANTVEAMREYIKSSLAKMTNQQSLEALQGAEAGNQRTDQARALPVINAINRAAAGYNKFKNGQHANPEELSTIKGQIMAPRQFTSFTGQTPKNLQVGVNSIYNVLNKPDNPQAKTAHDIVGRVASGKIPDFTNNSMYYATPGGAGRGFIQSLHRDKNVQNFGTAGAHVYAGDKELSPVAKINYPNVRDDLQREIEAARLPTAAPQTPQSAATPATPVSQPTQTTQVATQDHTVKPFTPQQQAPVQAPNETATQNFLKGAMAPEPPQGAQIQQGMQPQQPQNFEGDVQFAPEQTKAEPTPPQTPTADNTQEILAKPMNAEGPEMPQPQAPTAQAQAPEIPETPQVAPADINQNMASNDIELPTVDTAAYGGTIKNHKSIQDGLRVANKYAKGGGAWTRAEGKNPKGGLNAKGRASLKAEGHDIKPPQPEGGPRKKSFCSRMGGMAKKFPSAAKDPNSRLNKSLRVWKCP